MGLFFSSLTRNQVASAVLTFLMMILYLGVFLFHRELPKASSWRPVLRHIDYIELWYWSQQGILIPKHLLFHVSAAIVWLFATVKVLEARRWA
jgi:hypothetical protein